jgi:SAM-dependent methyltransferase
MPEHTYRTLRETFNTDPVLYDQARPGYPAAMYRDLAALAGTGPGCRVLEIGCGTGQATLPLARAGCQIVAVELGDGMAGVARRKLAAFPGAAVVVTSFEDYPLPAEPFDVVLAATSWHWVDPAVRVGKAARALRPGGALATVSTHHIAGGTQQFFADAQDCYLRFDPSTTEGITLEPASAIPEDAAELAGTGFGPAVFRRYEWDLAYTTRQYLDVIRSYSSTYALTPEGQAGLLHCLGSLIDGRYGGRIVKRYLTELRVAHLPG